MNDNHPAIEQNRRRIQAKRKIHLDEPNQLISSVPNSDRTVKTRRCR